MVNIYDVAKEAGVSHTTVSRVLNKKQTGIPVSKETNKRVIEAARRLNYIPNRAAKNLSTGQTNCFCFLLCDRLLTNVFYYTQLKSLEAEVSKRGFNLLFSIYQENEDFPPILNERAVDGIFVTGRITKEIVTKIKTLNIPFILLGTMADKDCEENQVKTDIINDIKDLYSYLIDHGHKEIAYISDFKEDLLIREIIAGCNLAYNQYELIPRTHFINTNVREPYVTIKELIINHPELTAFIIQRQFVTAFTSMMGEQGLHIPNDISAIVYGDELLDEWQKKYFTHKSGGAEIISKEAVKSLIRLCEKQGEGERINISIPSKIIEGRTVKRLQSNGS